MRRLAILAILTFTLSLSFLNGAETLIAETKTRSMGGISGTPAVRLIRPTSQEVNIRNKKGLLFKWSSREVPSGGRQKYIFQLYKGYKMYKKNLLLKKELDPYIFSIFVKEGIFKDGMTYTWSIRQRGNFASWSKKSFCSFGVIK